MKREMVVIAVLLGVAFSSAAAHADSNYYWSGIPGMAAVQSIQDQQQNQAQPQRLSPRNRLFLSPIGQPQHYDAVTINRYMMGSPKTNYRIKPVVIQPMQ